MLKGPAFIRDVIQARFKGPAGFCAEFPQFDHEEIRELCKGRASRNGAPIVLAIAQALNLPYMPPEWWGWGDAFKPERRRPR